MSHFLKTSSLAGAVALALLAASAAEAATLVVRSNGPSAAAYPPGKALDPSGSVVLKAGDSVTVLDAGGTRVLKGPGKVAIAASGGATAGGFGALLASNGVRQSRTGATRGAGSVAPRPTNVWQIDASRGGGVMCVISPASLAVWRPDHDQPATLTITRLADGKTASLAYRLGQSTQSWPVAELPVTEGARYRLEGAALPAPTMVTLHLVVGAPTTLDDTAQALIAGHCTTQVDLLVQSTMDGGAG